MRMPQPCNGGFHGVPRPFVVVFVVVVVVWPIKILRQTRKDNNKIELGFSSYNTRRLVSNIYLVFILEKSLDITR